MLTTVARNRAYFILLALGLPLALIVIQVFTGLGGILLLIAAILWMGLAILILPPLMGVE